MATKSRGGRTAAVPGPPAKANPRYRKPLGTFTFTQSDTRTYSHPEPRYDVPQRRFRMKRFVFMCVIALVLAAASAYAAKIEITYMAWYNTTESEAADIQKTAGQVQRVTGQDPRDDDRRQPRRLRDQAQHHGGGEAAAGHLHHGGAHDHPLRGRRPACRRGQHVQARRSPLKSLAFTYKGKTVGYSCADEVLCSTTTRRCSTTPRSPILPPARTRPGHGRSSSRQPRS